MNFKAKEIIKHGIVRRVGLSSRKIKDSICFRSTAGWQAYGTLACSY